MTREAGDETPGLENIQAQDVAPTDAVKTLADEEVKAYRKQKKTPTELHHDTFAMHADFLKEACEKRDADIQELRAKNDELIGRLETLGTRHATVTEGYENLRSYSNISTVLMGAGGVVVSFASFSPFSQIVSVFGLAVFLSGLTYQALGRRLPKA